MPSIATLPAPGPFERVVDVRLFPHGFTTRQTDANAGPAGSAIVRPNLENAAWHAATTQKWGGNIVWTGSTPRHTVAYNGPRGRYFGTLNAGGVQAMKTWFSHNGSKVAGPSGRVLGACVKTYASLPTAQTYTGTGAGTLDMQTPSTAIGALTGDYQVRCITTGATPRFLITGPDAQPVGVAEAGAFTGAPILFDGVLRFTLQSGAVPFALDDAWIVSVEEADQFVAIVVPLVDSTNRTETVWRRGVSLTTPWRQIASIAPVAGQVGGSLQPWFFNASATQAATCRALGADSLGYTLGVMRRALNLDSLTVADAAETSSPTTWTRVYSVTVADEISGARELTDVATSNITGSRRQLMAVDYDANQLVRVEIEFDGTHDGSSTMSDLEGAATLDDGQANALVSVLSTGWADLVWTGATEYRRLRVFERTGDTFLQYFYGVPEDGVSTTFMEEDVTEARTSVVLRDVIAPRADQITYTDYAGTTTEILTGGADREVSGTAIHMRHSIAGTIAADTSGPIAPQSTGSNALRFNVAGLTVLPGSPEIDVTTPQIISTEVLPHMGVAGLGTDWRVLSSPLRYAVVATGGLPGVFAQNGFQTGAQDTRGNWLLAAEIAAPVVSLWPGSFPGSGTYTLKAGGPDSLTPATVATLTAYSPDNRWDIGAF